MKKSLTLAMTLALGVSASAYAANPFSDVPVGHWAYDSVAKLVAAGGVEGFATGEFGGDKLLTRYEMAQIVAKAMAKGANCDKLAAEFADELDSFGVRIAKLEKDSDAVKITGEVRYHYADMNIQNNEEKYSGKSGSKSKLRSRLWLDGKINDSWKYTGMIQNYQDFSNDSGEEGIEFKRAYVEGKVGGVNLLAGRYNAYLVNGNLYDEHADGVELSYGKDVKVTAFYMKPTDQEGKYFWEEMFDGEGWGSLNLEYDNAWGFKIDANIGVIKATAGYTVFGDGIDRWYEHKGYFADNGFLEKQKNNKVWNIGAEFNVAKDLKVSADYLKSNFNGVMFDGYFSPEFRDDDGYVLSLTYKGALESKPGTYGLYANYYDQSRGTVIAHTMNGFYGNNGFKGYMIGANYTLEENIIGTIEWYKLQSKGLSGILEVPKQDMETIWAQVVYTF